MPNLKYKINGVEHTMTAEEQATRDAEVLHYKNVRKPLKDWKLSMIESDVGLTRQIEDLITDKFAGDAGPNLQARYDAKIVLRGQRP